MTAIVTPLPDDPIAAARIRLGLDPLPAPPTSPSPHPESKADPDWDPSLHPRGPHGRFVRRFDHLSLFSSSYIDKITAKAAAVGFDRPTAAARIRSLIARSPSADFDAHWYHRAHTFNADLARQYSLPLDTVTGITAAMSPLSNWEPDNQDSTRKILRTLTDDPTVTITAAMAQGVLDYDLGGRQRHNHPTHLPIGTFRLSDLSPEHLAAVSTITDIGLPRGIGYRNNLEKAIPIFRGGDPDDHLGGPKTRSFYSNMLDPDDPDPITVDTHMTRAMMDDVGLTAEAQKQLLSGKAKKETGVNTDIGAYPLLAEAIADASIDTPYIPSQIQAIAWSQWIREHPFTERRSITRGRIARGEMDSPTWVRREG